MGFLAPSEYLIVWSKLFQAVVSQAGTFFFTGKFHNTRTGIFKCEGGCHLARFGDLVLHTRYCNFDFSFGKADKKRADKMAEMITAIVIEWDPMDPIDSMINSAAKFLKKKCRKFTTGKKAKDIADEMSEILKTTANTPFNGDALSDFFDYNPFQKPKIDREYLRYCLVNISGHTHEEVDQQFADEDLGDELLEKINEANKKRTGGSSPYGIMLSTRALCCSPRRDKDGLKFWVNTGRDTEVDGWRTEEELRAFINSDRTLVDLRKQGQT